MLDNMWYVLGVFSVVAGFCVWAERNTKVGKQFGSIVLALIGGLLLVNLKLIPRSYQLSGIIYGYFIPISIPLLLFQANVRRILKLGRKMLGAFVIASLGALIGGVICTFIFDLGPETYKVFSVFTASGIGGVGQMAAVGNAIGISESMWTVTSAVSTVFCILWLAILSGIYNWKRFRKGFVLLESGSFENNDDLRETAEELESRSKRKATMYEIGIVMGAAIAIAGVSIWLESLTGIYALLFSSTIAIILASTTKVSDIPVAEEIGMYILLFLMINMGAGAVISDVIAAGPMIVFGCFTMYVINGIVVVALGKITKTPLEFLMIGSNAAVGGPTTSAPMALLYGWKDLVLPALLMGVLGYIFGNYIGLGMGHLLGIIMG